MKEYIIFTPVIANIGGAQLYVLRRAKYLKSNGYEVKIITTDSAPLLIKELNNFPILTISMNVSYKYLPKSKRKLIIDDIVDFIKNASIIESHTLTDAIICEVAASMVKIKHVIYLLSEANSTLLLDKNLIDYFEFKLKRFEIFGITNKSLSLIFKRNISAKENKYVNISFDKNEFITDDDYFYPVDINQNDFVIGTISRLEKSTVIPIIEAVYDFASDKDYTIHFIIYGDSKYTDIRNKYQAKYKNTNNLKIYFPGYLNSIPNNLFRKLNVYVGVGTTVVNSIAQGCPTLVFDPIVNRCAGILGKDVFNFGYSENGKHYTLKEKIEEIRLLDSEQLEKLREQGEEYFLRNYELNITMKKLDDLIATSTSTELFWEFKFKYTITDYIYIFLSRTKINLRTDAMNFIKSKMYN